MSMQKKLKTLARILKENTSAERIYHYYHPADEEAPFIVWQEDGEQESFHANNTLSIMNGSFIYEIDSRKRNGSVPVTAPKP